MKRGPKIIYLRRKVLAAVGCVAAALLMCWVAASPEVVGAASTGRQLPIYCVQKDYKVLSISFDDAWGNEETQNWLTHICRWVTRIFKWLYSILKCAMIKRSI